jgi:pyruvate kinase
MSARDASDIRFAVRQGADFIAASFVSEPDDVRQLRDIVERRRAVGRPSSPRSRAASA